MKFRLIKKIAIIILVILGLAGMVHDLLTVRIVYERFFKKK